MNPQQLTIVVLQAGDLNFRAPYMRSPESSGFVRESVVLCERVSANTNWAFPQAHRTLDSPASFHN